MTDPSEPRAMCRILAICDGWPWPIRCGGQHRLAAMLQTLNTLGELDVCIASRNPFDEEARAVTAAALSGARLIEIPIVDRPARRFEQIRSRRWPWWDPWGAVDFAAMRASLQAATGQRDYDVVWSYTTLGAPLIDGWNAAVRIVDLPELHDVMLRRRANLGHPTSTASRLRRRYHDAVAARAWHRVQKRACKGATIVTVCSEIDRDALGEEQRAVVVGNGYDISTHPVGRPEESANPRTILFQGSMFYYPNADAAVYFAHGVLPLIRKQIPDVEFRIVGTSGPAVEGLAHCDGIVVVGRVDRMEDELAKADAVVVPLRIASGTRLKMLEAWTHRIPVHPTTVGAEGLPVTDNGNVLLGDSPASLAQACVRVLTDGQLRVQLAEAGRRTVVDNFDWADIKTRLAATLKSAIDQHLSQRTSRR